MVNVGLNVSMRSNLLSLQNVSRLQDVTQNRLATGLKVNSAIDNPDSFYTAQVLSNRASDLSTLLDAMSQGIQTLKAVSETIASASKFLEQAKSVANGALENTQPIAAKVRTESELLMAINSGKMGLIVVDSNINMSTNSNIVLKDGQSLVGANYLDKTKAQSEINFNFNNQDKNAIEVGNNSIISGLKISYVTNYKGGDKTGNAIAILGKNNVKLSNLDLNHDTRLDNKYLSSAAIYNDGGSVKMTGDIKINVQASHDRTSSARGYSHGVLNQNSASMIIDAKLYIETNGTESHAIYTMFNSNLLINGNSELNLKTNDQVSSGIYSYTNSTTTITDQAKIKILTLKSSFGIGNYDKSTTNFKGNSKIDIVTEDRDSGALNSNSTGYFNFSDNTIVNAVTKGDLSHGMIGSNVILEKHATFNIKTSGYNAEGLNLNSIELNDNSKINITTLGDNAEGIIASDIYLRNNSEINIAIKNTNAAGIASGNVNMYDLGKINIEMSQNIQALYSNLVLNMLSASSVVNINNQVGSQTFHNDVKISSVVGAIINTNNTGAFQSNNNILIPINVADNWTPPSGFVAIARIPFTPISNIDDEMNKEPPLNTTTLVKDDSKSLVKDSEQYNYILAQFDQVIKDGSYKGINLLKSQNLNVVFNEDRSSNLFIKGVDATTNGVGLNDVSWANQNEVNASLFELDTAIRQLRTYASEFGNYFSIVTTREDFTQSMVNVLEEGADKLTLADINQESANMLSLQTRQQLAINSLSLASQASQSIIKLF